MFDNWAMTRMALLVLMLSGLAWAAGLMPAPAKLTEGQGRLAIDRAFTAGAGGCADPRVASAAARLVARIAAKTGIPIPEPRGATTGRPVLSIRCNSAGDEDESYTLVTTAAGATLTAAQSIGALRGMETFLQLVAADGDGFAVPAVRIEDRPRFPWRGLLIDSARHFLPIEVIKRNLDGMASVKFNVLHWHLSDDQGFRVESKVFPRLQQLGSDGLYYSQDQIREVIAWARDRGIRVVPEFEMPGHATAILAAYPELAAAPGPYQIERAWGIFDPIMDPTNEALYTFLDGFLGEMSGLFPDPYLHIGGDEVNGKQWTASPRIQEFIRQHGWKTNHDLQAYFNQRVQKILTRHGKRMMGWDEIFHPSLPKDIVIQSWRGQDSLAETSRQGYQGILSFGYYLDHMQTAAFHYAVDPLAGKAASLTAGEQARILGGEACMWAEYVTAETVDSRIWPRAAAIAERLWSPQSVTDVASMYQRMEAVSRDLEWMGLKHRANYLPMLERMTGGYPVEPLKTLVDTLEPVKLYARSQARPYTSATPLNRVVDAARPESTVARECLASPALARRWLARLRDQYAELRPALRSSFLLKEIEPVSADAAALGQAGLEAIGYVERKQRPPQTWIQQANALLERASKPRAEVVIAILPVVRQLIESASRLP